MKKWIAYTLLLILSLACVPEIEVPHMDTETESEGKVRITFSVPDVPVKPATKALGEEVELNELFVAVFGRNHYLKEYVKAQFLDYRKDENNQYVYYSYPISEDETVPVKVIQFNVTLSMSDSKRYLHFLLNGPGFLPYGTDKSILPSLTTDDQAYWQMVEMDYIGAEVEDGQYVLDDPNVPSVYKPDDYTKKRLGGNVEDINVEGRFYQPVMLIRNFAKVTITAKPYEESHFVPKCFALYNAPERGTYVPFDYTNGFILQYENLDYEALHDVKNYTGNFVLQGNTLISDLPSKESFRDPSHYPDPRVIPIEYPTGVGGDNLPAYLFERSVPTTEAPPTALIVYGEYYKENSETHEMEFVDNYFYRIDLMEKVRDPNTHKMVGQYYPVYRNIQYHIQIGGIGSIGHETPEAAAASIGSADVSSSITTKHLTDISNGTERLIVSPWLSHTLTQDETNYNVLSFVYYQDLSDAPYCGPAVVDGETILSVDALPMSIQGLTPVIADIRFDDGAIDPDKTNGYRVITFTTNENSRISRSQTIRISAGNLYRDVVITLQEKRQMEVTCHVPNDTRTTLWQRDKELEVDITVPNDLVRSMFPLQFIIEPEKMTLTPDVSKADNNLPVTSGTSIADETKTAFHFTRTVTLEEYINQPVEERMDEEGNVSRFKTFKCYFTPNRARSATIIWVTEENGFFDLDSTEFYNYPYFENFNWSHSGQRIPYGAGDVAVSFQMTKDENGHFPEVFLTTTGLIPSSCNQVSEGVYSYQPSDDSDGNITLNCRTTADHGGNVQLKLSADGHEDGLLVAKQFQQPHLINGQNYVSGYVNNLSGKVVKFGYFDEPEDYFNNMENYAEITISDALGLTPADMPSSGSGRWTWKPTTRLNTNETTGLSYHEISFTTTSSGTKPKFTLSAPGYVDVPITTIGRFGGDIINYGNQYVINKNNEFKAANLGSFINGNGGKGRRIKISAAGKESYCYVKFNSISSIDDKGVHLNASSDPYELSIETEDGSNRDILFYVAITFTSGYLPQQCQVVAPSGSTFEAYPATPNMYIWTLPVINYSGTLQLTAPAGGIVIQSIVIRPFRISGNGFVPAP